MALCHTFKSPRAQWNFRLSRAAAIVQHTEVAFSHFPPAWALNEAFVTLSLTLSHPPFLSQPLSLSPSTPTLLSVLINEGAKSQQQYSHPLWPWIHPSMSLFQVCLYSKVLSLTRSEISLPAVRILHSHLLPIYEIRPAQGQMCPSLHRWPQILKENVLISPLFLVGELCFCFAVVLRCFLSSR